MRLRLHMWVIEARLAGLLLAERALMDRLLILTLYAVFCLASIETYLDGVSLTPIAWAIVIFAIVAGWTAVSLASEGPVSDRPVALDLAGREGLRNLLENVGADVHRPVPRHASLVLSPILWRSFGCDPGSLRNDKSTIVIPAGCLMVWSVFDFRCYVANSLVRTPSPRWFRYARVALHKLNQECFQHAAARRTGRRVRLAGWFLRHHVTLLNNWELLAEIEADRRTARCYGASTVADWLQRYYLSAISVPACLNAIVAPSAARGQLLPVAESCRVYHNLMEPNWLTSLRAEMTKAERATPKPVALSAIAIRLGALQNTAEVAHANDPRPAASLFEDLPSLEETAVRNELGKLPDPFSRGAVEDLGGSILIPQMQEEVARNAKMLAGCRPPDIPDLIQRAPELAASYCEDRQFLLAPAQRQAMIPNLLTAFLAVELVKENWQVSYSVEEGLTLRNGRRRLNPHDTVQRLAKGELSRQEFLATIAPADPSPPAA
jgi:hypothetical protein